LKASASSLETSKQSCFIKELLRILDAIVLRVQASAAVRAE
jgi:hypothetical protein